MGASIEAGFRLVRVIFTHLSSLYACMRVHFMVSDGQDRRSPLPQMRLEGLEHLL